MAIVKTIEKDGCTMVFHDDYCKDKTPEEVKAILDRIAAKAYPVLLAQELRRQQAEAKAKAEAEAKAAAQENAVL